MITPARRRLMKDLKSLSNTKEKVYAQPLEKDLFTWVAVIIGPKDTPFENGIFTAILEFDESYPFNPPIVKFISDMYHPNIYDNGDLCLDILKSRWVPTYDVLSILLSIQSLLIDPNLDSPANVEAAEVMKNNLVEYENKIRDCVYSSWDNVKTLCKDNDVETDDKDCGEREDSVKI